MMGITVTLTGGEKFSQSEPEKGQRKRIKRTRERKLKDRMTHPTDGTSCAPLLFHVLPNISLLWVLFWLPFFIPLSPCLVLFLSLSHSLLIVLFSPFFRWAIEYVIETWIAKREESISNWREWFEDQRNQEVIIIYADTLLLLLSFMARILLVSLLLFLEWSLFFFYVLSSRKYPLLPCSIVTTIVNDGNVAASLVWSNLQVNWPAWERKIFIPDFVFDSVRVPQLSTPSLSSACRLFFPLLIVS